MTTVRDRAAAPVSATAAVSALDGRMVLPGNRWDLLAGRSPAQPPQVSVVIPYFDAQDDLDLVLAGLAAQTHPVTRLQIIVADDGSPQPPRVPPDVLVVAQDDRGFRAAQARNLGVQAADGDVLCFLDGDTVPEPTYVQRASRLPALTADALVVGRRRHADLTDWTAAAIRRWFAGGVGPRELPEPGWLLDAYRESRDLLDADARSYRHVISAVLTCTRELFDAAGGFDQTFTEYGGEDWEFAHRALTVGAVLAHEPTAVAWHDGGDWAQRSDDPSAARAQKNAETLALARLLPDPGLRGPGAWFPYPRVVVELAADDPAAAVLTVRAVLADLPDVEVWTSIPVVALSDDPRVHAGAVPDDVARRAPVRAHLYAPVSIPTGALAALVERVSVTGPASVRTSDGVVDVVAAAAQHRARRHGVEFERLFDVETVAAWDLVPDPPELWRVLPQLR